MNRRAAFTLIELVLVLAILAMMVALVAPALAKSSRSRMLEQEALRLVALTEYARDEAVSHGVAMAVYVDAQSGAYGMEPATASSGIEVRKDFTLPTDLRFETLASASPKQGRAITFTPEGTPDVASIERVSIADRQGYSRSVVKQSDGWGYQLAQEVAP
jgi:type II secretion system protein H